MSPDRRFPRGLPWRALAVVGLLAAGSLILVVSDGPDPAEVAVPSVTQSSVVPSSPQSTVTTPMPTSVCPKGGASLRRFVEAAHRTWERAILRSRGAEEGGLTSSERAELEERFRDAVEDFAVLLVKAEALTADPRLRQEAALVKEGLDRSVNAATMVADALQASDRVLGEAGNDQFGQADELLDAAGRGLDAHDC
jgi:hypothetical protein